MVYDPDNFAPGNYVLFNDAEYAGAHTMFELGHAYKILGYEHVEHLIYGFIYLENGEGVYTKRVIPLGSPASLSNLEKAIYGIA